ncbi:MAG: Eco57I restriction-modification methylase domain-containing protein [Spirochaetaceae bacterium]|jgi:hypothetical protein|nr:Eco57I restriction-modification methylase domain-containing protein [Spirochaetaceae bacterium]
MPQIDIKDTLNKAYSKISTERASIDRFKANFRTLLDRIKAVPDEHEEHFKTDIADFLKNTWYSPVYYINTSQDIDLVIHAGSDKKSPISVLMETKKPGNKTEMISGDNLNRKALQELLYYYLKERIINKNLEIKNLIITNVIEWFIFDASEFERLFANDKDLVHLFTEFESKETLSFDKTGDFYTKVAASYIEKHKKELNYTWFSITDYESIIRNNDRDADNQLINLYKFLSPENLLKLPFANDSNTLNENFYRELLYIMGLSEEKEGSKKIIIRSKEEDRKEGSLMESAIFVLSEEVYDEEEQFDTALELIITWINRILFLKLLESQLIQYHMGDKNYTFLNSKKIKNFQDLDALFFKVLALETEKRPASLIKLFEHVPYLNSSLFELEANSSENGYCRISNLRTIKMPVYSSTVLKDARGKKRDGVIDTLEYIFDFLDAYDFSSEGSATIQEESKTLINASVLGLIFEKINGYKDGSYFTPGFITTYICHETIERAVIDKFNTVKGWDCKNFTELYNRIDPGEISEANKIINSITICDPAVGSGHFLVSALNELIAIKSRLRILADNNGQRLRDYSAEVHNDELMIFDEDGNFFTYNYKNKESQRVQETIFKEKRTIIENCLFGVDINENSVRICRLRLWIELLKNAYYTKESNYTDLETLPNIDINIRCGDSLVSKFQLDTDIKEALAGSKYSVSDYQQAVYDYKNTSSKEKKRELLKLISDIKASFQTRVAANDQTFAHKEALHGELVSLTKSSDLFETDDAENKKREKRIKELQAELVKTEQHLEDIKSGALYKNAFEWRFEFPEVLDKDGRFKGFDAVVGNPPYGIKFDKSYSKENYIATDDIYTLFMERAITLCNQSAIMSLIIPIFWLTGDAYISTRKYIKTNARLLNGIILPYDIFSEAYVDTGIFIFGKDLSCTISNLYSFPPKAKIDFAIMLHIPFKPLKKEEWGNSADLKIIFDPISRSLIQKFNNLPLQVEDICVSARGILADKELYLKIKSKKTVPVFVGRLDRYYMDDENYDYIIYNENVKEKPVTYNIFTGERVLVRRIISRQFRVMASIIDRDFVVKKDIYIFKLKPGVSYPLKVLLAIINSRLFSYFITKVSVTARKDDFTQITLSDIRELRLPKPNKSIQSKLVSLVDQLLTNNASGTHDSHGASPENLVLERQIDEIVYGLYGLKEEEIRVVEGEGF